MNQRTSLLPHGVAAALHPLRQPPSDAPWNLDELDGLLSPLPLRDAAVLVGLVPRLGQWQVLLTRRSEGLRHHPGQVSFPGGRVEPDDAGAAAAALREAHEEIGLTAAEVRPLGWLDPLATITGFRVLPLVAEISPAFVPRPDPGEVADVFEVGLASLLAPGNLQRQRLQVGGRIRHVLSYHEATARGRRIWGATASILDNLRRRIEVGGYHDNGEAGTAGSR